MNYEEKYNEALEKLQEALAPTEDGCKISGLTRDCLEGIFPELAESEDERIRKCLINYFNHHKNGINIFYGIKGDDILAWLEKQGEKLDPDKVIAWLDEHVPTKFEDMQNYANQFKKDFGL